MNKQEFIAALEEMLEVDAGSLRGDEMLTELPWDSLAVVSFIAMADEHLNAEVNPGKLAQAESLADVLAMVEDYFD